MYVLLAQECAPPRLCAGSSAWSRVETSRAVRERDPEGQHQRKREKKKRLEVFLLKVEAWILLVSIWECLENEW